MFEDLAASIAQRNARFRAWRAHGMPLLGRWFYKAAGVAYWADPLTGSTHAIEEPECAMLRLACVCRANPDPPCMQLVTADWPDEPRDTRAVLAMIEGDLVKKYIASCYHLFPLFGRDPPEVVATTKLELLAGEPPR
jgi:hypothetical protein